MKNKPSHLKIFYLCLLIIFAGFSNKLVCQTITIDSTFTNDTEIFPFSANDTIYGLNLSGNVQLNSDTSLIRVILSDENGQEFMIYEAYPLIVTENNFSVENICDETCYLNQFLPYSVRMEVINASFYFDELNCFGDFQENIDQLQYDAKSIIDTRKIDTINLNIQNYGMRWVAGDNNVVELFYKNKKRLFGENYNLRGFDYYSGGIFELLGYKNYEKDTSLIVKYFDWRNRHGANREGSPYFDGDTLGTGWLTSVKNQEVPQSGCGSCYAFSVIGEVEAVTNLYFNQHIDFNLSEQELVCDPNNNGCNGGALSKSLEYVKGNGVNTEYCLPYFAHEDSCNTLCQSIDTLISIYKESYVSAYLYGNDSVKKRLISNGPLSWWYPVGGTQSHAVIICGYLVDPTDSTTIWICKNSFGLNWGDEVNGFCYLDIPIESNPRYIKTPVYAQMPDTMEVQCLDEDEDGYYFWGIGSKPIGCPACPDLPDCDDSNPNLGPYGTDYSCGCLLSYSSDTLFITSDTTWATNISQDRDIVISNGAELTITGQIAFAENARLIIKQGGKLIIDGGVLTKACTENWRGIEVWGNPDTTQGFTSLQGYLVLENSGKIEFAQTAVFTGKKSFNGNIIDGYEGGLVQAQDAIFLNNTIDIEFRPYQNMHPYDPETELRNLSGFRNCEFLTDFSNNEFTDLEAHVILRDVKDIYFYGCDFNYIDSYFNYSDDNGTGILSYDASFFIEPRCTDPNIQPCTKDDSCRFENLKYGIRAFNNGANKFVSIKDAIFTRNERGVYLSGLTDTEIISSKFYCNENLPGVFGKDLGNIVYGLYLDGCTGYHIENNEFYEKYQYSGCQISRVGLFVCNSGVEANEIYNNYFHNITLGIAAFGENRGEETGLCIKCNDFWSNLNDIWVYPDTSKREWKRLQGIAPYQGDPGDTTGNNLAGNTFTYYQTNPWGEYLYNMINDENCEHITYVHHMRQLYPHTWPKNINDTTQIALDEKEEIEFDKNRHCPSTFNGSGSIEEKRGTFDSTGVALASVETDILAYTDGGDTDELNSDVLYSQSNQSMELRQQLLNDSPYLSDTVMKSSISKENVLPNAMIRDVLVANPQSAKSEQLLSKLDERMVPMPDYMMGQIMQGVNNLGAKEMLSAKLNKWKQANYRAFNDITRIYQTDTTIVNAMDSLEVFMQNTGTLYANYSLAMQYINQSDFTAASNILSNIQVYDYDEQIRLAYDDYLDVMQSLHNAGKTIYEMDSTRVADLSLIVNNKYPLISAYARNTLISAGKLDYSEPLELPVVLKAIYIEYPDPPIETELQESYMKIYPIPAQDYCIVEYKLPENLNNGILSVSEINGKLLRKIKLSQAIDQQIISLDKFKNGIYLFRLFVDNKIIDSKKVTIIK